MGKASRTKRERRQEGGGGGGRPPQRPQGYGTKRQLPVFWLVVAGMVLAGIAAIVLTAPDDTEKERTKAAANVPDYAEVSVEGDSLARWGGNPDRDSAVGDTAPTIRAQKFDGFRTTVDPADGTARAYVFLAHWCPHCQVEVERIVEWAQDNEVPAGVEVVGISTSVSESQPNYPPAEWLAREDWPYDTLIDDEANTLADAFGMEGTPFMVFTDPDGKVTQRFSGEMPIADFEAALEEIAPNGAADEAAG